MADESDEVLLYASDLTDNVPDREETKEFICHVQQCAHAMNALLEEVTHNEHS